MLVEFSVKNFKSFKERQTLSMVASKSKGKSEELPQNLIHFDIPGLKDTNLLKSAVIYGANASGKSNIFKAMEFMSEFVEKSATELRPQQKTGVSPFLLDTKSKSSPTEFEILFVMYGVVYQYGFLINPDRVIEEWLYVYKSSKAQNWFARKYDNNKNKYVWKFSTYFKGDKEVLKEHTKDNTLFLSMAVQFNFKQLFDIFFWIVNQFRFIDFSKTELGFEATLDWINKKKGFKKLFVDFLNRADLGIIDIEIDSNNKKSDTINFLDELKNAGFRLKHKGKIENATTYFNIDDESAGTLKYFALLGPWIESITEGFTLVLDEGGSKLHSLILYDLIEMFYKDFKLSVYPQLILTTHDTNFMDNHLFRRDQIWFTEKNNEGESNLYPLTDYHPRIDESLEKGYLAGRYGGIPIITEELVLNE